MSAQAATALATHPLEFDQLARAHRPLLYRYAYRLCGHHHLAEDLVQDSLLRAWRSIDRLHSPAALLAWLKTIVRREHARGFQRVEPRDSGLAPEDLRDEHPGFDTSTEAFVVRRALRALPQHYREPLLLQVLHGLSQQEIAERLGLTSAGVGTRLFRARQTLRAALGERV